MSIDQVNYVGYARLHVLCCVALNCVVLCKLEQYYGVSVCCVGCVVLMLFVFQC